MKENTIQLTSNFYKFNVRNEKYKNIDFVPTIYITRKANNVIGLIVDIYTVDLNINRSRLIRRISYNEKIDNETDYFRHIQNSNFNLAIPNSLVFLDKVVTAIQTYVTKTNTVKDSNPPYVVIIPSTDTQSPYSIVTTYYANTNTYELVLKAPFNYGSVPQWNITYSAPQSSNNSSFESVLENNESSATFIPTVSGGSVLITVDFAYQGNSASAYQTISPP
jgi:hypothetical protein